MTLVQSLAAWVDADPGAAVVTLSTIAAAVVGTTGDLLARAVDGEKYPRIFQLAKALQNLGIALPTLGLRIGAAIKGTKPSDTPPPAGST